MTTTISVESAVTATLLVAAGSGNTLVNNTGPNTLYIGDNNAIAATDSTGIVPIQLGESFSVDGENDLFGIVTQGQTAEVEIITGGLYFSPSTVVISGPVTLTGSPDITINGQTSSLDVSAATVNVEGEGGYILPGQLALLNKNAANVSAGPITSTLMTTKNVANYSSIQFAAYDPTNNSSASGSALCAIWQFTWQDASGNNIGTDTISTLLGTDFTVLIPVKGTTVEIYLVNPGTVGTITYATGGTFLWGDYRVVSDITVLSYGVTSLPAVTGWNVISLAAPVLTVTEWIASLNETSEPTGQSYLLPLALWRGQVSGWFQQVAEALANDATIVDLSYATQGNVAGGTNYAYGILDNLPSAVQATPYGIAFNAPPTQLAFLFKTGSTANGETILSLTGV